MRQGISQRRNDLRWQAVFDSVIELGENQELIGLIANGAMTYDDAEMLATSATITNSESIRKMVFRRQLEIDRPKRRADLALRVLRDKIFYEFEIRDLLGILQKDRQ